MKLHLGSLGVFDMLALLHHPTSFLSRSLCNYSVQESRQSSLDRNTFVVLVNRGGAGGGGQWRARSGSLVTSLFESEGSDSSMRSELALLHSILIGKKRPQTYFLTTWKGTIKQTPVTIKKLKISSNMCLTN